MSTSGVTRYHPALVILHWALAFLIIADLAVGTFALVHIPNDAPLKIEGLQKHMGAGIAILLLMLVRLAMRVGSTAPAEASTGSTALDRVAWLSHRLLYVAVIGMAGSGLALGLQAHVPEVVFFGHGQLPADFWVYPLRGVHYVFARLLIALIALHIAGAAYHTFVRRDGLLRRMWFGRRGLEHGAAGEIAAPAGGGLWRYAPWLARFALAVPTLLFVVIGWKYLSDPRGIAAGSQIALNSPAAITDMRAEGAVFLALAGVALFSLVSTRRLLVGLAVTASVIGFITATRLLGVLIDGAVPETEFKLVPELVLLALSGVALLVELGRQQRLQRA